MVKEKRREGRGQDEEDEVVLFVLCSRLFESVLFILNRRVFGY